MTRYLPAGVKGWFLMQAYAVGRRGMSLACLGVIWICIGFMTMFSAEPAGYLLLSHGTQVRALAWIITGIFAITQAYKPQGEDAWGFLALYAMCAYRIFAYGWGFGAWMLDPSTGNSRGIFGVSAWVTIVAFILIVAGWPEANSAKVSEEKEGTED